MLLVNAKRGPSSIHGLGLIAQEFLSRGTTVWRFRPGFDVMIPEADFETLPPPVREQTYFTAYFWERERIYVLSGDDDRFTNHADQPNSRIAGDWTILVRDLQPGEEITIHFDEMPWLSPIPLKFVDRTYIGDCELGKGLFAVEPIRAGESILTFDGPRITLEEAIAKGETTANPLQIGPREYIDLIPSGVFINHSCDPNAGIRNDRELIALQDIPFGEEIRFDYSTTMWEEMWTMACRCGARRCRGVVEDFYRLPPEFRERYLRLGVVQQFIRDRLGAR